MNSIFNVEGVALSESQMKNTFGGIDKPKNPCKGTVCSITGGEAYGCGLTAGGWCQCSGTTPNGDPATGECKTSSSD